MLQQDPRCQLPQTVLPLVAPQVPSVVTGPVPAEAEGVAEPITGSVLVALGAAAGAQPD